jgi:hypothetical protein
MSAPRPPPVLRPILRCSNHVHALGITPYGESAEQPCSVIVTGSRAAALMTGGSNYQSLPMR